jgi:hypothetical protein
MLVRCKRTGASWDIDPSSVTFRRVKEAPDEYEIVEEEKRKKGGAK